MLCVLQAAEVLQLLALTGSRVALKWLEVPYQTVGLFKLEAYLK